MKRLLNCSRFPALSFCALFLPAISRAQFSTPDENVARSLSGQFVVTGPTQPSWLANSLQSATNADLVRLEPALLSVSAERIKQSLRRELGIAADAPWSGKIFLVLHPARSPDEEVTIIARPSANNWNYELQLPDVLPQSRFVRAMTGALLLEFANRNASFNARSAEIPAWLTDGLSEQLLAETTGRDILSSPDKIVNGLPLTRTDNDERGYDPLADTRHVLQNFQALTFEQLSWPVDMQLSGDDEGVYYASAQLFLDSLLNLKNGPAHLRAMLGDLPDCYNWQTAFLKAFRENFASALDVEKWWALQVVSFVARDPGSIWTLDVSREKLDEILSVPVNFRASSNAFPVRAEISLQAVIRNFDSTRQTAILENKLRDLELAQFRMARPLAALSDGYRRVLADYLGEQKSAAPAIHFGKHSNAPKKMSTSETLKKLDALDARRREIAATISPDESAQTIPLPKKI